MPTLPRNHYGYILAKSTVCNRTLQVSDAIVDALENIEDCRNISEFHLATITSLDLSNSSITTLTSDDLSGLFSLTTLNLSNNQLSGLPNGIFVGLAPLLTLDLSGNNVDPLPFTISLQKVGTHQIKAVLPSGAPSDIVLPITVTTGNLADNVTTITIRAGSVESQPLTVIRTPNSYDAVTVDIGILPNLPTGHTGYAFAKSNELPLEVFSKINVAPVFTEGTTATRNIAENSEAGTNIGTAITASDANSDDLTYSLSGTDANSFSINSTNGQIRTSASLDYETKRSYTVKITVSDGNKGTDTITVTINITDVDEIPAFTAPEFTEGDTATRSIAENTGSGVDIGSAVSANDDDDDDTLTYSLNGTDASSFGIDSSSGQLRTSAALDYETKSSYTVTVNVSDGEGGSDSVTVTINITDVDEIPANTAPEFTEGDTATRSIAENTGSGVDIGSAVSATDDDDDDDTLTYNLSGTDASSFTINSSSGQIRTSASLDYEAKSSYTVTVNVSDGEDGNDSITVTINITDVDEIPANTAPEFTSDDLTVSVAENTVADTNIGSPVSAEDADDDTLTYGLGGTDAEAFNIDSETGQLQTKDALDYETQSSYTVTVNASDGQGGSDSIDVTIEVSNVNEAPSFIGGVRTTRTIPENTKANINIGAAVTATDVDANTTLTYSLGGTDAASFAIDENTGQIKTKAPLDFENKASYTITVSVTDGSLSESITVSISVRDLDETPSNIAPVFEDGETTTRSVPENTEEDTDIGEAIAATDEDSETLAYLLSGTDASSFSIDDETGQLKTSAALDYEDKNSYTVTVTVSDGSLEDEITVTINVTNVNEAPVFADGENTIHPIAENTASGVDFGRAFDATDPDANTTLTYTLEGDDATSFDFNSTTKRLQTNTALDYESKNSYSVTLKVSDGELTDSIAITIMIQDVDENHAPVFEEGSETTRSVEENSGAGLYRINVSRLAKCAVRKPHLPLEKDKLR